MLITIYISVFAVVFCEMIITEGNIFAKSRVELYSTATVDGDITAPEIVMESGCRFNGMCKMTREVEAKDDK